MRLYAGTDGVEDGINKKYYIPFLPPIRDGFVFALPELMNTRGQSSFGGGNAVGLSISG